MAPRRKTRSGSLLPERVESAILPQSRIINQERLGKLRKTLVPAGRRGVLVRLAMNLSVPQPNETVIFTSFVTAGLLSPFSTFFLSVLEDFGNYLIHLAPNSVMILAIFAHLCEIFVGVLPSVALFRRYFVLRPLGQNEIVGSCWFHLRDGFAEKYIPQVLKNKQDDWRQIQGYITVDPHARLMLPTEPAAVSQKRWERTFADDDQLLVVITKVSELRDLGLTTTMVVADYLIQRLAPLRVIGVSNCQSRERLATG